MRVKIQLCCAFLLGLTASLLIESFLPPGVGSVIPLSIMLLIAVAGLMVSGWGEITMWFWRLGQRPQTYPGVVEQFLGVDSMIVRHDVGILIEAHLHPKDGNAPTVEVGSQVFVIGTLTRKPRGGRNIKLANCKIRLK